jgi:hypothetical protein
MIAVGVITPNEARDVEGLHRSEDPAADKLWMQGAMAPIKRLTAAPLATQKKLRLLLA